MEGTAKTKENRKLKKFTCPKCGCNHIVNSELDIQHSYYTEDQKKSEEVAKSEGLQDSEATDGKEDSGKDQIQGNEEETQTTEFEEEVAESEEEVEDEDDWGWDKW